jgi:hypothetical protein
MGLTLFIELVLLGVLMFFTALLVYKLGKKTIRRFINQYFRHHYDYALVETNNFEKAMAMFNLETEQAKSGNSTIININDNYCYDKLIKQLMNNCIVTIEHSNCDMQDRNCNYILKVVDQNGSTGYMKVNTYLANFKSDDGFESFRSVEHTFDLDEYSINNKFFIVITDAQLIVGSAADNLKSLIIDAFKGSEVVRMYRQDPTKYVYYYQLVPTMDGLSLSGVATRVKNPVERIMNVNYSDLKFKLDNKELSVKPYKAAQAISKMLFHNQNVGLKGPYGTGKSHFKAMITGMLNDTYDDVVVVTCGADVLKSLKGLRGKAEFTNALSSLQDKKIIFLIDEAEVMMYQSIENIHSDDNTLLLALLDGELKQTLNCACLLIYNADNSNLNPAFFRHGRLGGNVFEMTPLDRNRADQLVEELKAEFGSKYIFDHGKYVNLVESENSMNGYVYAPANQITTAEVVSCFIPVAVTDILKKELLELLDEKPAPAINIKDIFGKEFKSKIDDLKRIDESAIKSDTVYMDADIAPSADVVPSAGLSRKERRKIYMKNKKAEKKNK